MLRSRTCHLSCYVHFFGSYGVPSGVMTPSNCKYLLQCGANFFFTGAHQEDSMAVDLTYKIFWPFYIICYSGGQWVWPIPYTDQREKTACCSVICQDGHNKVPDLKQQTLLFSHVWRLKSESKLIPSRAAFLGHVPRVLTRSSLCMCLCPNFLFL